MTNQEWMCSLSAEEFLDQALWLLKDYGKRYTDSEPAIIEWLEDKYVVNLKVGDEFTVDILREGTRKIVCTGEDKNYYYGFGTGDGMSYSISKEDGSINATGRYYPVIAEIMKLAKEESEDKE